MMSSPNEQTSNRRILGIAPRLITLLTVILLMIAAWFAWKAWDEWKRGPEPETIVSASLESLREQNVLVPFTARFVAGPTSRVERLGLTAQKTLIVPGTVRYEIDLSKLERKDVVWDAATNTLTVTLPPLRVSDPQIDPSQAAEYRDGRFIMAITDAEQRLDQANWRAAREEIVRQARGDVPMGLARDAAKRAMEANFALPLRATGIDANVTVTFAQS